VVDVFADLVRTELLADKRVVHGNHQMALVEIAQKLLRAELHVDEPLAEGVVEDFDRVTFVVDLEDVPHQIQSLLELLIVDRVVVRSETVEDEGFVDVMMCCEMML
jgi:hypothetical protein